MTIAQLQQQFLGAGKNRIAPEDFFILLAYATNMPKVFLLTHPEYVLEDGTEAKIHHYCTRRLTHEPVAYIIGHKAFYGRDFSVTRDTLIPRPETERLIELVLDAIPHFHLPTNKPISQNIAIIDVGTGSGNIIVTLAKEISQTYQISSIKYYATDISSAALNIAHKNAERYAVDTLITFSAGSFLDPILSSLSDTDCCIIVANLPYLSDAIYQKTRDDVKKFEPHSALVSDQAGLGHYYALLRHIHSLQKPTLCFLEISPEQVYLLQNFIRTLLPQAQIQIYKDLAQQERVVKIRIL